MAPTESPPLPPIAGEEGLGGVGGLTTPVRLYLAVAQRSFRRHLAYRAATLAGLFTNAVFGVLIASVFTALYRSRATEGGGERIAGFDVAEMLVFVWVGQSLIMVLHLWGWWDVAQAVRSGDIVSDLMKPFDFYAYWLSRDLGRAACHVLVRFVPTMALGMLLTDLALPRSPLRWVAFAVSVLLGLLVAFAFRFMVNVSAFWLLDVRGVGYLAYSAVNFLSGFLIPLTFFPPWLRGIAEALPFRAMVMLPAEILLAKRPVAAALGVQLLWAVALTLLARAVLNRAIRKLTVQGG